MQIVYVAHLRAWNLIDSYAIIRQVPKVIVEGAVLLQHVDDVIEIGDVAGAEDYLCFGRR